MGGERERRRGTGEAGEMLSMREGLRRGRRGKGIKVDQVYEAVR